MKNKKGIIWGIIWILVGIFVALSWFEVIKIEVFFKGWWTLFIILPGIVGLCTEKDKLGNLVAICIGVFFLLWQQGVVEFEMFWKILVPIALVAFGVKMIVRAATGKRAPKKEEDSLKGYPKKTYVGVFSGSDADLSGEVVDELTCVAVFGGCDIDIRDAIFERDCNVRAVSVFGGCDIRMPSNVNVEVHHFSLFGGVENNKSEKRPNSSVTVHIYATCIFGGVDVL